MELAKEQLKLHKEGKQELQEEKIKELLLKRLFDSSTQQKAIEHAARESTKEQKKLLDRYHTLVKGSISAAI